MLLPGRRTFTFRPTPPTLFSPLDLLQKLPLPRLLRPQPAPPPPPLHERTLTDGEFYALPTDDQIRYAMLRPVPTALPRLRDWRLEAILFKGREKELYRLPEKEYLEFYSAFHPERLEFRGDRLVRLTTNDLATKHSREFGLEAPPTAFYATKPQADIWEAYLAALEKANGRRALLEFLTPLVRREYFAHPERRYDTVPSLQSDCSPEDPLMQTEPPVPARSATTVINAQTPLPELNTRFIADQLRRARDFSPSSAKILRASRFKPPSFNTYEDAAANLLPTLAKRGIPFALCWTNGSYILHLPDKNAFMWQPPKAKRKAADGLAQLLVRVSKKGVIKIEPYATTASSYTEQANLFLFC
ncbi:hypothetical protein JCM10207_001448 [Rhodosporidiobolus poonsookiae]